MPENLKLAESIFWLSRRVYLDHLILDLRLAWDGRFHHQANYFIRRGAPLLQIQRVTEAKRKPPKSAGIEAAVATLDDFQDGLSIQSFERTIPAAVSAGAEQVIRELGPAIQFDVRSPLVQRYLEQHSAARLGRDVDQTTKDRLRTLLATGYEERWTYRETVKQIRGLYQGFTERRGRRSRSEVIATHELGQAYSEGSLRFAGELEETGIEIEKAWAPAANPCPAICSPNVSAGWIPLREAFPSGHQSPLGHVGCYCSLMTRQKV